MTSENRNIAWVDLECTDSEVDDGSIIEIGCVVTTIGLEKIATFQRVVDPMLPEDLDHMKPVVREMHTANGLLYDLAMGKGGEPEDADAAFAAFLSQHKVGQQLILAGSGVGHFDSKWIRAYLPDAAKHLTYWTLDVGVIRRFLRIYGGVEIQELDQDTKNHRALDDILLHLEEGRAYAALIQELLARPAVS